MILIRWMSIFVPSTYFCHPSESCRGISWDFPEYMGKRGERMYGDTILIFLIVALLIIWLGMKFNRWLKSAPVKLRLPNDRLRDDDLDHNMVQLLDTHGYRITSGKHRISIQIQMDDEELYSRLFVDCFAEQDGDLFVVKRARERIPLELTGSAVRDRLLVYQLIYHSCAGVLYVDPKEQTLIKFTFEVEG